MPGRIAPVASPWLGFAGWFAAVSAAFAGLLLGFVVRLDPYGTRASAARRPTPIMDINQRYMYPQLVRSGLFDAAVFGTSTIRLLDPRRLGETFGGRFANLGLNAGTPWEQLELAELFRRHVPAARAILFGLDRTWCDPDAADERKRLTFRSFPPWLYDDNPVNDLPGMMSMDSLEVAIRVALNHAGVLPERIRGDGFEVFLPPERSYDPERARRHIWSGTPGRVVPETPPAAIGSAERARLLFPALDWLDGYLGRLDPGTRKVLILPPIHVAAQARPGSRDETLDGACKARLTEIARRRGAALIDFRRASALTEDDANYWDKLHFRLPVARVVVDALAAAITSRQDAPDGTYRVLAGGD